MTEQTRTAIALRTIQALVVTTTATVQASLTEARLAEIQAGLDARPSMA